MYRKFPLLIIAMTLGIVGILLPQPKPLYRNKADIARKVDIPDLYLGLEWKLKRVDTFEFASMWGRGRIVEGYSLSSEELDTYPKEFVDYYLRELESSGWKEIHRGKSKWGEFYDFSSATNMSVFDFIRYYGNGEVIPEKFFRFSVKFPDGIVYQGYVANIRYSTSN